MLFRFSLYGFLKNQRYFEPFLILAFLEKGMSFTQIGFLIAFREICINVMEIPTGAVADILGRRRAMIFSHLAYIGSFAIFASASAVWMLFAAMALFALGEAFRTGTHKAIIFTWLEQAGRSDEMTKIYGFTRSWSNKGSAVCVVISAAMVFTLGKYSYIFYVSIIPYLLNIINFLSYPSGLDGPRGGHGSIGGIVRMLSSTLGQVVRNRPLRRLMAESMGFAGSFKVSKDYLQPVIQTAAVSLPLFVGLADRQRTAVLVGAVYFVLYLASSWASSRADALARLAGSQRRGSIWLWWLAGAGYATMAAGLAIGLTWAAAAQSGVAIAIAAFAAVSIIQNFWRPIMVSRVTSHAKSESMATVLSVESQAKSAFAAIIAPLLGLTVDAIAGRNDSPVQFLPVALLGLTMTFIALITSRRSPRDN